MASFLIAIVVTVFLLVCWGALTIVGKLGEAISEHFGDFALLVFCIIIIFLVVWGLVSMSTVTLGGK